MTQITKEEAIDAIRIILEYIGEDVNREGLIKTPERVIKSYEELFCGYKINPEDIFGESFTNNYAFENIILLRDIKFASLCEHHMLPFVGTVDIGYIPGKKIAGVSKLARVVEAFSRKLQMQERLTIQIANFLHDAIKTKGVATRIRASHLCMSMRGVKKEATVMETFHFTGIFASEHEKKQEFMSLTR
ncbi:MAG: GTP cyclohydrolase I FolE [Rickettsiaceae bacterium]|nr:GTP cyclohydrolase I FolE [Rickettsiaceae bacterium]